MIHLSHLESGQKKINIADLAVPEINNGRLPQLTDLVSPSEWEQMLDEQLRAGRYSLFEMGARMKIVAQATGYPLHYEFPEFKLAIEELLTNEKIQRYHLLQRLEYLAQLRQIYGDKVDDVEADVRSKLAQDGAALIHNDFFQNSSQLSDKQSSVGLTVTYARAFPPDGRGYLRQVSPFIDQLKQIEIEDEFDRVIYWADLRVLAPDKVIATPELIDSYRHFINQYKSVSWKVVANLLSNVAILLASQVQLTPNGMVLTFDEYQKDPPEVASPPSQRSF